MENAQQLVYETPRTDVDTSLHLHCHQGRLT